MMNFKHYTYLAFFSITLFSPNLYSTKTRAHEPTKAVTFGEEETKEAAPRKRACLKRSHSSLEALAPKPFAAPRSILDRAGELQRFDDPTYPLIAMLEDILQIDHDTGMTYARIGVKPNGLFCRASTYNQIFAHPGLMLSKQEGLFVVESIEGDMIILHRDAAIESTFFTNPAYLGLINRMKSSGSPLRHLFSSKVISCVFLLMHYIHEQKTMFGPERALIKAINAIGSSFIALCHAGYNPAPLLRSCIDLAVIINAPLLTESLGGFAHNCADYLAALS